ncbi:MAG: LPS export ABC transporter periplasmic protein LptC [Winogradskyella sp.]|nr:LPS export ABC transporter periplasmic protein LptC [Winogradskyella sp.]
MKVNFKYQLYTIVIAFAMTMFFSCENNFEDVQKVGVLQNQPIGIAENINLKYTDSAKLVANLLSPKMLDFSNRDFGFSEFPKGITLTIYDDDNNHSKVFSDYAVYYSDTNIIDLQGNVIIATHNLDTLFTEQLFYDEELEWVFTNKPFRLKRTTSDIQGNGFDSDKSFNNFQMLELGGDFDMDN